MKIIMTASVAICLMFGMFGCNNENSSPSVQTVPRSGTWGIYEFDLTTEAVKLIHSSDSKIEFLILNKAGDTLAFSQQFGGNANENEEICTLNINGGVLNRITTNSLMDVYPVWSPDGTQLAFLSWRGKDLDIYVMDADGSNQSKLYDSGGHDADIDWLGDTITFTSGSQIWLMQDDGTAPVRITNPPNAGIWGDVNLPFGDYDPRFSPDGQKIAFERLEDDASPNGNYNMFVVNVDGTGETRLTSNGLTQGIVSWSHSGAKLVYVVSAIGNEGMYDMYMMNHDGSNITNINPDYFPSDFLCHSPVFSADDSKIYFIGQWWN